MVAGKLPMDKLSRSPWDAAHPLLPNERVLFQCVNYETNSYTSTSYSTRKRRKTTKVYTAATAAIIGTTQRLIYGHTSWFRYKYEYYSYQNIGQTATVTTSIFVNGNRFLFTVNTDSKPRTVKVAVSKPCVEKFALVAQQLTAFLTSGQATAGGSGQGSEAAGPFYRREPIPPSVRFAVFHRDNFTCVYCGARGGVLSTVLHIDHRVPVSRGGTNEMSNLCTACQDCNLGKSDRML